MSTATRAQHRADQWEQRVSSGDWGAITAEVNKHGGALLPRLLTDPETDTGRTPWTSGSGCATTPGRTSRPRSCSATARVTGTHCTATCTET